MKARFTALAYLAVGWSICFDMAFGHDQPVHRRITEAATDHVRTASSSYAGFLTTVSSDVTVFKARQNLSDGSDFEDRKAAEDPEGGWRQLNHFYDPLTGLGLSNLPADQESPTLGNDSFVWASTRDCPGIDVRLVFPFPYDANVGKYNKWSWQNARDHQWDGLTSPDPQDRNDALRNMFRAIGQVVHLLQDASSPQHVRNEQHLAGKIVGLSVGWSSPIEIPNVAAANFQNPRMLDWKAAGFNKLEDFWNRHAYNGNAAALTAEANSGPKLGLAEWANGNFIGERHIYAEWMIGTRFEFGYHQSTVNEVKKPGYYPYPSRDKSTNYEQVKAGGGKKPLRLKDGTMVQGDYVSKIADGVLVTHHSRLKYLGAKGIKGVDAGAMCTIDDQKVVEDYHAQVIPKAIEYTAGLLDYFFRGKLEITVSSDIANKIKLTVKNVSGQDFKGGVFKLYAENAGGDRAEITPIDNAYNGSLAHNATFQLNFLDAENRQKFLLVYKGTIGTDGGNALDPVDADVAIAAKDFAVPCSRANHPVANLVWSLSDFGPQGTTTAASVSGGSGTFSFVNEGGFQADADLLRSCSDYDVTVTVDYTMEAHNAQFFDDPDGFPHIILTVGGETDSFSTLLPFLLGQRGSQQCESFNGQLIVTKRLDANLPSAHIYVEFRGTDGNAGTGCTASGTITVTPLNPP